MNMAGLVIGLFGAAFSIWAIRHLRASFGLRTAVRELVSTGPYSRIRHPDYRILVTPVLSGMVWRMRITTRGRFVKNLVVELADDRAAGEYWVSIR